MTFTVFTAGCRNVSYTYGSWSDKKNYKGKEKVKLDQFRFKAEPICKFNAVPASQNSKLPVLNFRLEQKVREDTKYERYKKRNYTEKHIYFPLDRFTYKRNAPVQNLVNSVLHVGLIYPMLFIGGGLRISQFSQTLNNSQNSAFVVDVESTFDWKAPAYNTTVSVRLLDLDKTISFKGNVSSLDLAKFFTQLELESSYYKLLKQNDLRLKFSFENDIRKFDLTVFKKQHQKYLTYNQQQKEEATRKAWLKIENEKLLRILDEKISGLENEFDLLNSANNLDVALKTQWRIVHTLKKRHALKASTYQLNSAYKRLISIATEMGDMKEMSKITQEMKKQ